MMGQDKVYSFDLEGRLIWFYNKPFSYQRGLNNQVLLKWRDSTKKYREYCEASVKESIYNTLISDLQTIYTKTSQDSEKKLLDKLLYWTPLNLNENGEKFSQIYQPISILPPDQYSAIVLQAAIGCSYNRCSFCNFYKERSFYIKNMDEFSEHIRAVKLFLGQGVTYRKHIFLADGDALMIPQARLLKMMKLSREVFPERNFFSFMDAFRNHSKSTEDYKELKLNGLKRVYIGLETGCSELLSFLEKPGTPTLMKDEVLKMKEAGLNVGIIIMLGVGGNLFSSQHIKDSIEVLNAMNLEKGDIIYFSEFIEHPDQKYTQKALESGISALSSQDIQSQFEAIKTQLEFKKSAPQLSQYHLNEYIY